MARITTRFRPTSVAMLAGLLAVAGCGPWATGISPVARAGALARPGSAAADSLVHKATTPSQGCEDQIYANDFEESVGSEWSSPRTDVTPSGRRFLGQFANDVVTLRLDDLPEHSRVTLSFDLFILLSWDGSGNFCCGPDVVDVSVENGPTLLHSTFSNTDHWIQNKQSFPGRYPGPLNAEHTGASESNTLGYTFTSGAFTPIQDDPQDSVYQLRYSFVHTDSTLVVRFQGENLQSVTDESWGLDNVCVSVPPTIVALTWNPPDGGALSPPQDLTARIVSAGASRLDGLPATPGAEVTGYKVYRSTQPNVQPSPNNIFGTYPPTQTNATAPVGNGGAYFVVTACYADGESPPSNEVGAGTPGATISSVRLKGTRLIARGTGFTDEVSVFVDGLAFTTASTVKKRKKVIQRGTLETGETLSEYLTPGREVTVAFVNSDQSVTRLTFVVP